MGALEFIESLVDDLAWPLVAGLALVLFRGAIGKILERVSKAKIGPGGVEIDTWEAAAEAVVQGATGAPAPVDDGRPVRTTENSDSPFGPTGPTGPTVSPKDNWLSLTHAYLKLGHSLRELVASDGLTPAASTDGIPELTALARAQRLITFDTYRSLHGLEVMYQLARANPREVTSERAREFQTLVNAILYVLETPAKG